MKHNIKKEKNYTIHHYKSDKYKSIYLSISFRKPIKKEEITKYNILFNVLFSGCKKYPTDKELNIEKENLYNASILYNTQRLGNYSHTYIDLNILSDKYTEKNNLNNALKLIREILFNPLVEDDHFNKKIVQREKKLHKEILLSIKDNPSYYAHIKAKETYGKESVISYRKEGYIKDLNTINEYNLYEFYKHVINNSLIDFYVVGNIDFKEITKLIDENFNIINNNVNYKENYYLEETGRKKENSKTEKINNTQTQLVMIYKPQNITKRQRHYILPALAGILGGNPSSKLFKIIREEKSLCYTIGSGYSVVDNVMYISCGIDKSKIEETIKNIKIVIDKCSNDLIEAKDIDQMIETAKVSLDNKLSYNYSIVLYLEQLDILNYSDIEKQKEEYSKITKKELQEVTKQLKLNTTYILEGDINENN